MRYHSTFFHSDNIYPRLHSSNRKPDRHRASQRQLAQPLSLFDPSLRTIYRSALEAQARSRNIVVCNPYTKQAEEIAYPLTVRSKSTVTARGIKKYLNALRLGFCCWCSLCSERPRFAKARSDAEGAYLECYQCGFYVDLDKIYETATRQTVYPEADQSALRPVTIYFIGEGDEFPFRRDSPSKKYSVTRGNVKREIKSPELPSTVEEILKGLNDDGQRPDSNPEKSTSKSYVKGRRQTLNGKQPDIVEDYILCPHCEKYLRGKSLDSHIFSEDCIIDLDSD